MPDRPRFTLNRVLDGVLAIFERDAQVNADKWFMPPKAFQRGVGPHILMLAPVLAVSLTGTVRPVAQRLMNYGQSEADFQLTFYGRHKDAETACGEVMSDLWRVLMENRQLTDVDDPDHPTLLSGFLSLGETQQAVQSNPTLGEFTIEQRIVASYTWSAEAP